MDRSKYIGGSDIPALLIGEHYGRTPYSIWLEKTGQVEPQEIVGPDISRGVALQNTALDLANIGGVEGEEILNEVEVSMPQPWARGHIDRSSWFDATTTPHWIAEAKCPRSYTYAKVQANGPFRAHVLQLQYYLWLSAASRGYLVYFCADSLEVQSFVIMPSRAIHEAIIERCESFWQHVQDGTPPELPPMLELQARLSAETKKREQASPELALLMERARQLDDEIKRREQLRKEVMHEIARLWPDNVSSV